MSLQGRSALDTMPSPPDTVWLRIRRFAKRHDLNSNYLYILPALAVYLFYVVWPVISVFRDSLYDWDGIHKERTFIGLGNFQELIFQDHIFRGAIKNNVIWAVVTIGVMLTFGFLLAYLLNQNLRLRTLYRTCIFLPLTASAVVVGLAWNNIYHPDIGLLNTTLRSLGLGSLAKVWLGDADWALYAILVAAIWQGMGSWVVIYLASLQSIPSELFEAAMIDGANGFQRMWYVAIPLVQGTTRSLLILGAIGSVGAFGLPYLMTRGGPYHATEMMALRIFDLAFVLHRTGYSSAVSVLLVLIAGALTVLQLRGYKGAALGE